MLSRIQQSYDVVASLGGDRTRPEQWPELRNYVVEFTLCPLVERCTATCIKAYHPILCQYSFSFVWFDTNILDKVTNRLNKKKKTNKVVPNNPITIQPCTDSSYHQTLASNDKLLMKAPSGK